MDMMHNTSIVSWRCAALFGVLLASLAACSRAAPVEPPAVYNTQKCVEGARIDQGRCSDGITSCIIYCIDGKASKCGPCEGLPDATDAAPPDGAAIDAGTLVASANNACSANLAENKPKRIALNQTQSYVYNANRSYLNDTRPSCASPNGADGPDGVTTFAIVDRGTLSVRVKSAERGTGTLSVYARAACENDAKVPATQAVCAAAACTDGTQASCATVCMPEHEITCKNALKDGDVFILAVNPGERILVGWNHSDPSAGSVSLDVSLLP
jgi:hypothetical protein